MMEANITENIFKEMPAVICTAGSNIIALHDKIPDGLMGKELFDHMDPIDTVKFSAHFYAEGKGDVFYFPVKGLAGFGCGAACFKKILDRRYAVVFLFEDMARLGDDMHSLLKKTALSSGYDMLLAFTRINDSTFSGSVDVDVIDVALVAEYLTDCGYLPDLHIRTALRASEGNAVFELPLNVPRRPFLQIMMLTLGILDTVSVQRAVALSLCKACDRLEMRFVTDRLGVGEDVSDIKGLCESCPQASVYACLLEYTCRLYNARLDAFIKDGTESLSLVLTFYDSDPALPDFKSCDCLEGICGDLSDVLCLMDRITYKEAGQG